MKKTLALCMCAVMGLSLLSGCGSEQKESATAAPETKAATETTAAPAGTDATESAAGSGQDWSKQDVQVAVMWGAGGALDTTIRAMAPYAEEQLDTSLIVTNRTGGGGSIAMQYVDSQPSDGFNILAASEGGQLVKVMDTGTMDLDDFQLINIYGAGYGVVLVAPDSPYNTIKELVDDILANPNKIKMASAGTSSSPFTINAMMTSVHQTSPNLITYDGDNAAVTALMGGEVDYTAVSMVSAASYIKAGSVKALALISNEPMEALPDIPVITDTYPEYEKYLPWTTFWGVWVKKDTPKEVVDELTEVFRVAADNEEFKELLVSLGATPMNLSGEEATEYSNHYKSVTSWLIYDSGAAAKSPEEFNIPRVEE